MLKLHIGRPAPHPDSPTADTTISDLAGICIQPLERIIPGEEDADQWAVRDIVVVGGSAGSLEAIQAVVRSFPAGMRASVFIVTHVSSREPSYLAHIVGRAAGLPVQQAAEGDSIELGRIYVAAPDRDLLIADQHLHLTRGPKEGLHRPSINATFRSAATVHGPRVIGVLLSGLLDDGAAGLWEIARHGGVTIVQDPEEAPFPSMPLNALQDADIDLQAEGRRDRSRGGPRRKWKPGAASAFKGGTCLRGDRIQRFHLPECRGPLYSKNGPGPVEFRCRLGHILSLETLVAEASSTQERKLYEAIVALEEGSDLASFAAGRMVNGQKERFLNEALQLREFASAIRRMIERRDEPPLTFLAKRWESKSRRGFFVPRGER